MTCPCGSFVAPRNSAFWKRVCLGSSLEETIEASYVDYVNDSSTFALLATPADVCDVLLPAASDACAGAEVEFMALLLNLASGRLCLAQPISAISTSAVDVDGAAAEVDTLLANPARVLEDCQDAADIATEINLGQAIPEFLDEEMSIEASTQLDPDDQSLEAVVLSWVEPDASAAGRPTVYEVHRSLLTPDAWSLLGETQCSLWFPHFGGPGSSGSSRTTRSSVCIRRAVRPAMGRFPCARLR